MDVDEKAFESAILAELSLSLYRNRESRDSIGNENSHLNEDALSTAQHALDAAETAGDTAALARAHTIVSHLYRLAGNVDSAATHGREALLLAEESTDLGLHVAALNSLALAHARAGSGLDTGTDTSAARRAIPLLQRALALCQQQGDRHREAALHNNLADVYHLVNEPAQAMQHLTQAVIIFAEIGSGAGGENPEIWKLAEW